MIMLDRFFARVREGELTAIRCRCCAALALPPKDRCDSCGGHDWGAVPLAGTGTIASFRLIDPSPGCGATAPYAVAMVRLTEGLTLPARIVDLPLSALVVGQPVRFRPLTEGNHTAVLFGP
jgi:uncharacterized OB-fold protein